MAPSEPATSDFKITRTSLPAPDWIRRYSSSIVARPAPSRSALASLFAASAASRAARSSAATRKTSPLDGTSGSPEITTAVDGPADLILVPSGVSRERTLPDIDPTTTASPTRRVPVWTMTVAIGPPFVLLAATSPLVQVWSRGPEAHRLYAVSNLGSAAGLLLYVAVIEPASGLHAQGWLIWAVAAAACAGTWRVALARTAAHAAHPAPTSAVVPDPPAPSRPARPWSSARTVTCSKNIALPSRK